MVDTEHSPKSSGQKSFRNRSWLIQGLPGTDELKNRILQARGLTDDHLRPRLSQHMVSVRSMPDVDRFAELLLKARTVGLFGDYDVDGIASVALWKRFLTACQIPHIHYLPNRADGYGPSKKGIDFLLNGGVDLILFLDCGSNGNELIDNLNLTVLVLDHHKVLNFTRADAFINPYKYLGQEKYYNLCTASLSFLVIVHIVSKYGKNIDLMSFLDLVALATIADVMELDLFNRACIRKGLELLNTGPVGLTVLIDKLKLHRPITGTNLAFYLVPTLNAAGRIGQSELALRLLVSNDPEECAKLSDHLILLNQQRKSMSDTIFEFAKARVKEEDRIIIVRDHHWHPGIVGITAGQLREYFNKTAFVFYKSGALWKGSGRSANLDLGKVINTSILNGLAETGGGHTAAGGISIMDEKFEEWAQWVNGTFQDADPGPIHIDTTISELELQCMPTFYEFAPFGRANPNPCFLLPSAWIKDVYLGRNYLQCMVSNNLKLFCFRPVESMKQGFLDSRGRRLDLVLRADETGKLLIYDARFTY